MKLKLLLVLGAAVAACGGNTSFSARVGAPAAAARPRGTPASLTLANGIVLTRVRVVLQRIQLKREDTSDSGGDSEVKVGPFLTDFSGAALDGGSLSRLFDAAVPQGTYKRIKFKVHKVEDADASTAALTEVKGKSVLVDGTIDGAAFSWSSSLDEEQERKATFVIGGGDNLTFNFNPTGWFTKGGARLDPRVAQNQSDIEKNIKDSLDCYDDDDGDGKK